MVIGFVLPVLARWGLTGRVGKAVAYIGGALLVAGLLGGIWLWLGARENADDKRNQEIGRDIERAESVAKTLDQIERANDAEEKLDRDAAARLANCRLHSRTPENCRP